MPPQRILDEVAPGIASAELSSVVQQWLRVDDGLVEGSSFSHLNPRPSRRPVRVDVPLTLGNPSSTTPWSYAAAARE